MSRRWTQIALFAALVLLIYAGTVFAMAHVDIRGRALIFRTGDYYNWPGGDSWTRYRAFDPGKRYDALIIGSSHAYRGYDPAVFAAHGHDVYNLGSNAQTPLNSYHIIQQYVDSRNCPLLIFDVYEGTFINTGLESTADLTQNIPSGKAALGMAWDLRQLRGLNMMALRWSTPHRQPYYLDPLPMHKGFVAFRDSVKLPLPPNTDTTLNVQERQQVLFEDCVKLCKERGIRMVVSQHQVRKGMNKPRHRLFAAGIDSLLAGTGVRYLDFAFATGLNDVDHFADNNHLNATGARIFTEQLVDSLETLGYLIKE